MKNKFILMTVVAASFILPVSTLANTDTTVSSDIEVSITSGDFYLTAPQLTSRIDIVLTSEPQSHALTTAATKMAVVDNRGTREGWNVTVSASQLTEINPPGAEAPFVLPYGSLKLNTMSNATPSPSTVTSLGTLGISGPAYGIENKVTSSKAIDLSGGGALQVLNTPVGNGMGSYEFSFPESTLVMVADSVNTHVRSGGAPTVYGSTITWNLISGPGV